MKWFEFEEEKPRLINQLMRIAEIQEDVKIRRGGEIIAGKRRISPEKSSFGGKIESFS